jgi:hypothetical protein
MNSVAEVLCWLVYTDGMNELYKTDKNLALDFITDFSIKQGNNTVKKWKEFYAYLFTKYMDGNIKTKMPLPKNHIYVNPKVEQPGYGLDWYKKIIQKDKDHFRMKKLEGEESVH